MWDGSELWSGCIFVSPSFYLNNIFLNIQLRDKMEVIREGKELYFFSLIYTSFAFLYQYYMF